MTKQELNVKKALWLAAKRAKMRETGRCATCCIHPAVPPRSICSSCVAKAARRTQRRRVHSGNRASGQSFSIHERAGDVARKHHFYDGAAEHYEDALRARHGGKEAPSFFTSDDDIRIAEKIVKTYALGERPVTAMPWLDRLIATFARSRNAAREIDMLSEAARFLWIDMRSEEAIPVRERAVTVAEANGDPQLRTIAHCRLANTLIILGRVDEAHQHLQSVEHLNESLPARTLYHEQRGFIAALYGQAQRVHEEFEKALELSNLYDDIPHKCMLWGNYATCATMLGDFPRAKQYCEQGIFLSRAYMVEWLLPQVHLHYAHILAGMGEGKVAHTYLLEALASTARTPSLDQRLASTGIPIALDAGDERALAKCHASQQLEQVFQSRDRGRIEDTIWAFTRLYMTKGRKHEAQRLLHRALEFIRHPIWSTALLLSVAEYGALSDAPHARALLVKRSELPTPALAEAALSLFDAYIAQRKRNTEDAQRFAREAVERYDRLQWYREADRARQIAFPTLVPMRPRGIAKPFSSMNVRLTPREQEIAELVLRGLTNREVAATLSISRYTVESHVHAIMERLGIRSRHQLSDALAAYP